VTEGARKQGRGVGRTSHRAAAWFAWSLWALSLAAIAASVAFQVLNASTPTAATRGPVVLGIGFVLVFVSFATVGALVASRQPANLIGWIFCALGLFLPLAGASEEYALYALVTQPGSLPGGEVMAWLAAWFAGAINFALLAFVSLLFPDGRLLSRRWRFVVWVNLIAILLIFAWNFEPGLIESLGLLKVANPFGVAGAGALLQALGELGFFLVLAVAIAGAISLVIRFRRSRGEERQQIKWFTFVASIAGLMYFLVIIGQVVIVLGSDGRLPQTPFWVELLFWLGTLGFAGVPVAIGLAVLKYRLYDIDVVINLTLVYGSLTAMLVAVYFGGVATTQTILRALTGQTEQPQLAIVVSTLAIAALFNPLRRRIQSFIDRRFCRRKYDARKTLEAFSARLREETDLESLNNDLAGVIRETMQPAHVSLWLRPDMPPKDGQAER
jgi:hypothetical protein